MIARFVTLPNPRDGRVMYTRMGCVAASLKKREAELDMRVKWWW